MSTASAWKVSCLVLGLGVKKMASCWVLKEQPPAVRAPVGGKWLLVSVQACSWAYTGVGWRVWCVCVVWVCLLFENCTVDASIFVVKFVRANGGCLGMRSR
jgi:hypothetical protein